MPATASKPAWRTAGCTAAIWRSDRQAWPPPLRPPGHLVHRLARHRVDGLAGVDKAMLLIEADGAGIVLVDLQFEAGRREAFGLIEQRECQPRAPLFGRDHDLVEIVRLGIDGDEAGEPAVLLDDDNRRYRRQLLSPAFAPPGDARIEIDVWKVMCPGATPQLDRRVFVGGGVGAELHLIVNTGRAEGARPGDLDHLARPYPLSEMAGTSPAMTFHRSVNFSSMRRLRR